MNRFHVHVHVNDLAPNIRFYSQLFGAEPTVVKADYAKWMLDDPRVNFAISLAGADKSVGVGHLGIQTETPEALADIGARLRAADAITLEQKGTSCCYAKSDKFWALDPQGLHWESFRTLGTETHYSGTAVEAESTCCAPTPSRPLTASNGCAPKSGCC